MHLRTHTIFTSPNMVNAGPTIPHTLKYVKRSSRDPTHTERCLPRAPQSHTDQRMFNSRPAILYTPKDV